MVYRLGLIGYPIKHSLSPWIHNSFLEKAGLQGEYQIIEINPEESFQNKIEELKNSDIDGFNITVPYKQKIIPYLDDLDEHARNIGAVNTVLNKNGKWIGYNTDGIGYVRSLESKYPKLFLDKSINILILGAGGAARGIYYGLISVGFQHIDLANRTINSAMEIANLKTKSVTTSVLTIADAELKAIDYDVIIQTTSVGMRPHSDQSIIQLSRLKSSSVVVSDIVYQPIMTKILEQAEELGANIHFGHTMLLYQAQYAFQIWTNQEVPIDNMDEQLQHILEGR